MAIFDAISPVPVTSQTLFLLIFMKKGGQCSFPHSIDEKKQTQSADLTALDGHCPHCLFYSVFILPEKKDACFMALSLPQSPFTRTAGLQNRLQVLSHSSPCNLVCMGMRWFVSPLVLPPTKAHPWQIVLVTAWAKQGPHKILGQTALSSLLWDRLSQFLSQQ